MFKHFLSTFFDNFVSIIIIDFILMKKDELLWGAAWLHRATRNPMYLKYIERNGQVLGASEEDFTFGWDNKHVGARILLSKVGYFFLFLNLFPNFLVFPI